MFSWMLRSRSHAVWQHAEEAMFHVPFLRVWNPHEELLPMGCECYPRISHQGRKHLVTD